MLINVIPDGMSTATYIFLYRAKGKKGHNENTIDRRAYATRLCDKATIIAEHNTYHYLR